MAIAANARGVSLSVCGEAAADPIAGPVFVGLGLGTLSVAPGRLADVRGVLDAVAPEQCRAAAEAALGAGTLEGVRAAAAAALGQQVDGG